MSIQKYTTKSGARYSVRLYVRKDENGKQEYYVKKGFKTLNCQIKCNTLLKKTS